MSYRVISTYDRYGKIIHLLFVLGAIISGALATIILASTGLLPKFTIFLPNKLPENKYLHIALTQRELFPFYIHFLSLSALSYLIFRLLNLAFQKISLSSLEIEVNKSLKFTEKMAEIKTTLDDNTLLSCLYNLREQLAGSNKNRWSRFVSTPRRRLSTVFEAINDLSAETILLINDTASSADYAQIRYGYKFMQFLARLVILIGLVGTIIGLVTLVFTVISGDIEINVAVTHLRENFTIAGYSIIVGTILLISISVSNHLDEKYLNDLDNFLVTEIVQKTPFKNPDSLVLLKTYITTLRNIEKSVDDQLSKLNNRIDTLLKIRKQTPKV